MTSLKDGDLQHSSALAQSPKEIHIQCRPLISAACTLRSRCVHAAFSVAHFLNYQSERSVNAAQRSRGVNAVLTLSEHRIHADLALCERYVDTEQTQGKRAADICSLAVNADWTQTRHTLKSALDTETSHQSYLCSTWSAFNPEIQLKFFAWPRGITTV